MVMTPGDIALFGDRVIDNGTSKDVTRILVDTQSKLIDCRHFWSHAEYLRTTRDVDEIVINFRLKNAKRTV